MISTVHRACKKLVRSGPRLLQKNHTITAVPKSTTIRGIGMDAIMCN